MRGPDQVAEESRSPGGGTRARRAVHNEPDGAGAWGGAVGPSADHGTAAHAAGLWRDEAAAQGSTLSRWMGAMDDAVEMASPGWDAENSCHRVTGPGW